MNAGGRLVARFTAALGIAELAQLGFIAMAPEDAPWASLVGGILYFGLLGLFQGWSLSNFGKVSGGVLALCSAATALMWHALVRFGPVDIESALPLALAGGVVQGVTLGVLQAPLLRRIFKPVAFWPVATTAAWTAGILIQSTGARALMELGESGGTFNGVIDILASMIIGGITGVAALKLLRPGDAHDTARRVDETGQEHHR